jgi:hypothetical protein
VRGFKRKVIFFYGFRRPKHDSLLLLLGDMNLYPRDYFFLYFAFGAGLKNPAVLALGLFPYSAAVFADRQFWLLGSMHVSILALDVPDIFCILQPTHSDEMQGFLPVGLQGGWIEIYG